MSHMERTTWYFIIKILLFLLVTLLIAAFSGSSSENEPLLPDHLDSSSCPKDLYPLPVILISLDGFRADYMERGVAPTLQEMKNKGSYTPYMTSSYPTLTFPNHYTLVTGLYPESHGIVSNVFYDPETNEIYASSMDSSHEGRWYGGEPIWITVKKYNLISATHFWPGSEAPITGEYPTYWLKYNRTTPLMKRVDKVMEWIDLPPSSRPSWISIYSPHPDREGHKFGPNSDEVTRAVAEDDEMIRYLISKLKERNLLSCVNIIVVSDHGMASTGYDKVIHVENLISEDVWDEIELEYSRITLKTQNEEAKEILETSLTCKMEEFQVFRREELPKRLHYSGNKRNGDYVFLLDDGYTVTLNSNFSSMGSHDYDNHKTSMHGLFVAYGPAFRENFEVKPFQNIELYNLMCYLLSISPAPNNGTEALLSVMLKRPPLIPSRSLSKPSKIQLINETQWKQNYEESDCQKNRATLELSMTFLNMSDEQISTVEKKVAPWGLPQQINSRANFRLLFHPDHVTGYSSALKLPLWTSFSVERTTFIKPDATSQWFSDIRLEKKNSPSCLTSENIPENDLNLSLMPLFQPEFSLSETTKLLSFLISGGALFSKQLKPRWNNLTMGLIPEWLKTSKSPLTVIVGPVFDRNTDGLMDDAISLSNDVAIPTDYFAIVTRCATETKNLENCAQDDIDSLAFIYPQTLTFGVCLREEEEFALLFSAQIRDVEHLTGLEFFPHLRPSIRLKLITKDYWQLW